mgnify:CR=1 FL=1
MLPISLSQIMDDNKRLEEAEKKITILLQDGEEVKEENFNVD